MVNKLKKAPNLLNQHFHRSKWSSIEKIHGWVHYEVLNVFLADNKVEMISVCDKSIKVKILISELGDTKKWVQGWKKKY
tara:strand:+ start:1279 stop:1515 length:237 start_codon:yes stop_codon:yes gene_type:complete